MTNEIKSFSFNTPGSPKHEWGGAKRLSELFSEWFKERNLMIVKDDFSNESGLLQPTKTLFEKYGFNGSIFDDVVAESPEHVLMACFEQDKQTQFRIFWGLEGGSPMGI